MRVPYLRLLLVIVVLLAGMSFVASVNASGKLPRDSYAVEELPSLGGSVSAGNSINNQGLVAGYSALPDDTTIHAATWDGAEVTDLGTLGGPNSAVLWPVKHNSGLVVGVAETDDVDPYDEDWSCSAFFPGDPSEFACVGFVVEDGEMTALPTLGGTHGFATGANNRGQVVGWAETTVEDETCVAPQRFQFLATVWEKQNGEWQARALQPLPGDTVTAATAINDRGQVVGISGICDVAVGRFSARHAVLWEPDGSVVNIGSLGGVAWNTPMAINNRGFVVGFGNVSASDGGAFREQAFFWSKWTGIRPLGTLSGDTRSQALGLNNRGQIVGQSCNSDGCQAVFWHSWSSKPQNLNDLTQFGYTGHLAHANDINDRGQITGAAVTDAGDVVAFRATSKLADWLR